MSACCMVTWIFMFACREEEEDPLPDWGAREARKFRPSSCPFPAGESTSPLFREKRSSGAEATASMILMSKSKSAYLICSSGSVTRLMSGTLTFFSAPPEASLSVKLKLMSLSAPVEPSAGL